VDEENARAAGPSSTTLGRKSWTAFAGVVLIGLLLLAVAVPLGWRATPWLGLLALILISGIVALKVWSINSCHLYSDDVGVWVESGVLPWSRGVYGVKWRDLDEATYSQSLWSWLFKSYAIRIGHRYTKSSEILLSHIARGNESVMAINQQHQDLIRRNLLR
jgi:uncharacterized membrane protein YdbT with pleckstrin-like domain